MKKAVGAALIGLTSILLTACLFTSPPLPQPQADKALLVMGFSTDLSQPYEGGQLYSGFNATKLDSKTLDSPLSRGAYLLVEPGSHRLEGECFWKLRGVMPFHDDLREPGTLEWQAKPGKIYTLASEIDEYKFHCALSVIEKPWH